MTSTDYSTNAVAQHVTTLLDDLITWHVVGSKSPDGRGTSNIQPHGGAWMPTDRSFDRMLFWRTAEQNSFQLVEYSLSRNIVHNAVQIYFGAATTVLPNVFIVEITDREEICLMFATHLGVYRWVLAHPNLATHGQLEASRSILGEINEDYLHDRNNFHRYDLQHYGQVTCAYTTNHLIYAFHNEIETLILRFDNQNHLASPQQFIFPKRQSSGLFNFLWNPNKSVSSNAPNQPLMAGQTTIIYGHMTMTVILYENGLLRFLSDQLDTVLYEHNLSVDVTTVPSKVPTKMFLDYCQYETFADELVTRLFVILDSNDLLHLLIYEFQYDRENQFKFTLYQNKTYSKNLQANDHAHLPHGSSLTSMNCTNDRIALHFLNHQNRSIVLLIQYELKNNLREQFIPLPLDKHERAMNDELTTIDEIERRLNSPGQFTMDMIKEALWITFNLNLDDFNQSWTSVTQVLQQLPTLLQTLCNDHCDDEGIANEDRLRILTQFWQNLYSTLIDLRAQALVLLGCRMFDERQLIVLIHKSAVSLYATYKPPSTINPRYSRYVRDIDTLLKLSEGEVMAQMDDALYNDNHQVTTQNYGRILKYLDPVANNDQLIETLQAMYDKHNVQITPNELGNTMLASKVARRLLALVFVQLCNDRIEQIERLNKLLTLVFRSTENQLRVNAQRMERIQEKALPYLQDLMQIYQVFLWLSSCGTESSMASADDRDMFIENLLSAQGEQQYKTRLGNQSLVEQILADCVQYQQLLPNAENWYPTILNTAENLFALLWPSHDFLMTYLPSRYQWSILDQYCSKLCWFKELNSARQFFQALAFYRAGSNVDTATRYLAGVLKELHTDPLLVKLFGQKPTPELFYIEWNREYLKYFGQAQNVAAFLHQSLQSSHSNDIRALIIKELFKTSLELKNFDDAFWCIQNTTDYFSQKQFTFDYALAICGSTSDQALYRLQTLLQYQRDKLGYVDLELVAYLERTCVEHQPINASHVYTLYEIYKMIKLPLKMAQIMYHYGCSINDINEQKKVFQFAFDALQSIASSHDSTDRLFIYPINNEYNYLAPLNDDQPGARLIGLEECRQKLAMICAIHTLRTDRASATLQVTDTMHPTQLSGLLMKFHHQNEAQQLLEAFQLNKTSSSLVH